MSRAILHAVEFVARYRGAMKVNLIVKGNIPVSNSMLNNDYPIIHQESELAPVYLGNDSIVDAWAKLGSGSNFRLARRARSRSMRVCIF